MADRLERIARALAGLALCSSLTLQVCAQEEPPAAPGRTPTEALEVDPRLAEVLEHVEADEATWNTEVWSARVSARLKRFGKDLGAGRPTDELVGELAIEAVGVGVLRAEPRPVGAGSPAGIRLWRSEPAALAAPDSRSADSRSAESRSADDRRGRAALARELDAWRAPLGGDVHFHAKVVHVTERDEGFATELLVEALGHLGERAVATRATWLAEWTRDDPPRLTSLAARAHEEAHGPATPLFTDVTAAAFAKAPELSADYGRSLEHWAGVLDRALGSSIVGHHGLAVGDADGDGRDDVYLCAPGGLPNRLLLNTPDGSVRDAGLESGVALLDASRSALFLDLDGDGDQDLVVEADPQVLLFENQGGARFRPKIALDADSVTSMAAADVDLDGDLDLYLCGYIVPDAREYAPVPYHDANNGRANRLMRNLGEWRFEDATVELGLDENNRRFSFAASFEDFDNDGDPDLYVSNDFGRNNLYRNDGGRFRDVAAELGVEDIAAGMGVTWGDVDGDPWPDLYVSNMFSSAGERVTYQRRFRPDLDATTRALLQRHARGNTLFRGSDPAGGGAFVDASVESGVTMGRWAWGSLFVDVDGDGLDDVLVPNGFVTGEDPEDL